MNKDEMIENLQYELNITLEAALLLAGVKKDRLEDAVQRYIECVDDVLDGYEGDENEVLVLISHLKNTDKDLFS
ncbi:hypothetical protein CAV_0969 [Campylobacter avium LMG 24591]|uniref:Uncharacterized protein n=1 Tax=Campylobacter avium LMG 24591 TaxID=522484 RepID=A0A222MX83_9BACT|nr:hypothetical protein [Campylobacter avium]ASQ30627.1 hypothetical protein CAV_0969 [Campylobacter avium LMG 24591]OYD79723.1 hypothetical protein CAV8706_0972 [Campylobacter avium]